MGKAKPTKAERSLVDHARPIVRHKDPEAAARFLRGFRNGTRQSESPALQRALLSLMDEAGADLGDRDEPAQAHPRQ